MWSCVNIPAGQYFNMLGHTDFWLENRLKWWTSSCSKIWCWNQQNQSKSHLSALIFLPAEPIYSNISRADHNNNNNNNNNHHHHHPHPDDFLMRFCTLSVLKNSLHSVSGIHVRVRLPQSKQKPTSRPSGWRNVRRIQWSPGPTNWMGTMWGPQTWCLLSLLV